MDSFLKNQLPDEVDLDGHVGSDGKKYIGKAKRVEGRTFHCLANVDGALCVVEVTLSTPSEFGIALGDD